MNLLLYGLVALAVMGAVATGVYKVKKWGGDEVRAEWSAANEAARKAEAARSAKAASDLEAERKKKKVVIQERTVYVDRNVEKLVDSGVCLKPAGVSCLNGAIDGKGAAGCEPGS